MLQAQSWDVRDFTHCLCIDSITIQLQPRARFLKSKVTRARALIINCCLVSSKAVSLFPFKNKEHRLTYILKKTANIYHSLKPWKPGENSTIYWAAIETVDIKKPKHERKWLQEVDKRDPAG